MDSNILALISSLRNARWGLGIGQLINEACAIDNAEKLYIFLKKEARIHYENYFKAGREEGLPFDETYKKLKKLKGDAGLCNSEIGMVAALWGAKQVGCSISAISLSEYFGENGMIRSMEELKLKIENADSLLLCTPVYFGDRSSLVSDFIEEVRSDKELCQSLRGKPVAGVSVGAKRNGGQETTLIYQLLDMTNLGMLGVGNDSESTSQYGGTIHAGDVGTAADDDYGLNTAIGTGRRLARVVKQLELARSGDLNGKLRVVFWILQDNYERHALKHVRDLVNNQHEEIDANIIDFTEKDIRRCLACDICPTHIGPDIEYRCVNKSKKDGIYEMHNLFLDQDMIVPVVYSGINREGIRNVYQRFIERTRYIRRGDYLFTDTPIIPLIFEEIGANENYHVRMLTSLIRHHTIMFKSNICYIHEGNILNMAEVKEDFRQALLLARKITIGKLMKGFDEQNLAYKPVGYILSAAKEKEASVEERREILQMDRFSRRKKDAEMRLRKS